MWSYGEGISVEREDYRVVFYRSGCGIKQEIFDLTVEEAEMVLGDLKSALKEGW